jgi:hypothetical protein
MPLYRISYAQWDATELLSRDLLAGSGSRAFIRFDSMPFQGTAVAEVEARNPSTALRTFFREGGIKRDGIVWLDEDGIGHELRKGEGFEPEKDYIWIEEGLLTRLLAVYQGTPGTTVCRMCGGSGEMPIDFAEALDEVMEDLDDEDVLAELREGDDGPNIRPVK